MSLNVLLLLHFKRRKMLSHAFNLVRYLLIPIFGICPPKYDANNTAKTSIKKILQDEMIRCIEGVPKSYIPAGVGGATL